MDIVPISFDGIETVRSAVLSALDQFFDPLTGGSYGRGWDFGQVPHKSDIYRLLSPIRGIRLIRNLTFTMIYGGSEPSMPFVEADSLDILNRVLVYSGKHTVNIVTPDEAG